MRTYISYTYSCLLSFLFLAPHLECLPPSPTPSPRALGDITNSPSPAGANTKPTDTCEAKEDDEAPVTAPARRVRRNAIHSPSPVSLYEPPTEEQEAAAKLADDSGAHASATTTIKRISPVAAVAFSISSPPPPPAISTRRRIVEIRPLEDDESKLDEALSSPPPTIGCGAGAGSSSDADPKIIRPTLITHKRQVELNEKYYRGTRYGEGEGDKFKQRIDEYKTRARSRDEMNMFIELQAKKCFDFLTDLDARLMQSSATGSRPDEEAEYYWKGCKTGIIGSMQEAFDEGTIHGLLYHEGLHTSQPACIAFLKKCTAEVSAYAHPDAKLDLTDVTHLSLKLDKAAMLNTQCMLYWTGCKCAFLGRMYETLPLKILDLAPLGAYEAQQMFYKQTLDQTLKYCTEMIKRYQKQIDACPKGLTPHPKTNALKTYWQGFQAALHEQLAALHRAVAVAPEKTVDNDLDVKQEQKSKNATEVETSQAAETASAAA